MTIPRWVYFAVGAVVLAGEGFVLGRYTREPAKVEERIVTREVAKEFIKTVTVKEAAEVKRVVVYREKVTKPDGTVTERVSEQADTSIKTAERIDTEAKREVVKEKQQVTVSTARPDWRVAIFGGGTLTAPLLPIAGPLSLGVMVERRIAGPFSVGVWGLSSGQAGVALSVEF